MSLPSSLLLGPSLKARTRFVPFLCDASHRFFSSSSIDNGSVTIPDPTWSLKDLNSTLLSSENNTNDNAQQLQQQQQQQPQPQRKISDEELARLAKRCLLDIHQLKDKESLKRDLDKMMLYLDQVRNIQLPPWADMMTPEDIYDEPRGVIYAPVASAGSLAQIGEGDGNEHEHELLMMKQEMDSVWSSCLEKNTIQYGGKNYFSIVTKRRSEPK